MALPIRCLVVLLVLGASPCAGAEPGRTAPPPIASGLDAGGPGRPSVRLDQLELPSGVAGGLERHFRFQLRRAARRADWGAGRGAKIEFRVKLEELSVVESAGVLRVRCTAVGRLPRGKSARSHLEFGGDPRKRQRIVEQVLEIVARGVVTRLAALERARRKG